MDREAINRRGCSIDRAQIFCEQAPNAIRVIAVDFVRGMIA
jgi:hypothetical protein